MQRYIPHTHDERAKMMATIGIADIEDLFKDIPATVRLKRALDLPASHSELELRAHLTELSSNNLGAANYTCFLGAGAYDHYIPSIINHLLLRQEFFTAYTPYQPEISQGTLQAIFESQSMICELTGMDVANASVYDAATALAEAALMSSSATRRSEILVANTVHPESREVIKTYCKFRDITVKEVPYHDGRLDLAKLEEMLSDKTAAVMVQSPNFFGIIEDLKAAGELAHAVNALLVACVDPISLAILKSPGELGADITVGDSQSMGNALNYGGPYVGFMASTQKLLRNMPGRIVGATTDTGGLNAFVLTMQTREQHIRREKATSSICTNNALSALASTIYMTTMGKEGLKEVANQCLSKAHYAYQQLLNTGKFAPVFNAPFFKEFAVRSSTPVAELNKKLLQDNILGGLELGTFYPELADSWLLAVTEKRTRTEIDNLVAKAVN